MKKPRRVRDDEGFRIPKTKMRQTHADHLEEKRLTACLKSRHIDDLLDEDEDDNPHWLFRDED
jgi:hypothetical protein